MRKQVTRTMDFNSVFGQPKWLGKITISNFSSLRPQDNWKFIQSIERLIKRYNKE